MIPKLYVFVAFIAFYLFSMAADAQGKKMRNFIVLLSCLMLAFFAGTRDPILWNDSFTYIVDFHFANDIFNFSFSDPIIGYVEGGYHFLVVIIKSFTNDSTTYLTVISLLSFYFLYKAIDKYCVYPLFGICAYISRFLLGRNFMQIRAGLSYAIILVAVQYITKRDWKRYFALVLIAYFFHHSAIIAVPLYFLCLFKIKKWHIIMGLVIAFFIAGFYSDVVRALVADNATDLNVTTYVEKGYQRESGLSNPMIYFQLFLLLAYTFNEKKLRLTTPHYITIRNAYFYSTLILITLSCYTALSGRTSSMFATLEMVIIPSLILMFHKRNRALAYIGMGLALTAIFYMNYSGH